VEPILGFGLKMGILNVCQNKCFLNCLPQRNGGELMFNMTFVSDARSSAQFFFSRCARRTIQRYEGFGV
jgi:hypothetical protein